MQNKASGKAQKALLQKIEDSDVYEMSWRIIRTEGKRQKGGSVRVYDILFELRHKQQRIYDGGEGTTEYQELFWNKEAIRVVVKLLEVSKKSRDGAGEV